MSRTKKIVIGVLLTILVVGVGGYAVLALATDDAPEVAALDPGQFSDKRARYHALLVRAAARHTQSQLQGSSGSAALAAAQGDIRSAKALVPGQQPDAALYSPRFITLYSQTR